MKGVKLDDIKDLLKEMGEGNWWLDEQKRDYFKERMMRLLYGKERETVSS